MPRSYLRLHFHDDGDGTGKLVARAEANGFAGESGAYFDKQQLEAFAGKVEAFPLIGRPSISGGFYDREKPRQLKQEHLAIECYPIDTLGHLGLRVRLATELWPPSRPESQHVAALEILTTYEPLRQFSRGVLALLRGDAEEVTLEGE
jgi:hypothetical protein